VELIPITLIGEVCQLLLDTFNVHSGKGY